MANSRCTCSPRAPRTACAATDSARTPSRRSTRRPRWRSLTTLRARRRRPSRCYRTSSARLWWTSLRVKTLSSRMRRRCAIDTDSTRTRRTRWLARWWRRRRREQPRRFPRAPSTPFGWCTDLSAAARRTRWRRSWCPRRSASRRRNRTPASSSPRTRTWRWTGSSPRSSRGVSRNSYASEPSEGSITRFYRIRYTSPRRGVSVRPEMAERNRC